MKNNLLFVDDDEFILEALMRQMRDYRHEWNVEFASSGERALELMAEHNFDLVVADMRMPHMDGVRLLTEVMHRSPGTIRVILSGQSERDVRFRTIGSAHQYLSKPCDPESLQKLLAEVTKFQACLPDQSLRDLVSSVSTLPSLPSIVDELVAELESDSASVEAVGAIVRRDPSMTAKILQLANSSFFGVPGRVVAAHAGVELLGIDFMRLLTLDAGTFSQVEAPLIEGFSLDSFCRHSLDVAHSARAWSVATTGDHSAADEAFSAGLLHDIGQLVLAVGMPERYGDVIRTARATGRDLRVVEQETLGTTRALVGGYLLRLWGLTDSVVEAVKCHYDVGVCGDGMPTATEACG